MNLDLKNIESIKKTLDIMQIANYKGIVNLANSNDEGKVTIRLNNKPFYCIIPYITIIDSTGRRLSDNEIDRNKITVDFVKNGEHFITSGKASYSVFNDLLNAWHFKGFTVDKSEEFIFEAQANSGNNANLNYPLQVKFNMFGYELGGQANGRAIVDKMDISRLKMVRKDYTLTDRVARTDDGTIDNQIKTQANTFICVNPKVEILDNNGAVITNNNMIGNEFVIRMKNHKGETLIDDMPTTLFNKLADNKFFRPLVFPKLTTYTLDILGTGYPNESNVQRLDYDTATESFELTDTITGGTSGATGVIAQINNDGITGTLILTGVLGTFVDNEAITGVLHGSALANGVGVSGDLNAYPLEAQIQLTGYQAKMGA